MTRGCLQGKHLPPSTSLDKIRDQAAESVIWNEQNGLSQRLVGERRHGFSLEPLRHGRPFVRVPVGANNWIPHDIAASTTPCTLQWKRRRPEKETNDARQGLIRTTMPRPIGSIREPETHLVIGHSISEGMLASSSRRMQSLALLCCCAAAISPFPKSSAFSS